MEGAKRPLLEEPEKRLGTIETLDGGSALQGHFGSVRDIRVFVAAQKQWLPVLPKLVLLNHSDPLSDSDPRVTFDRTAKSFDEPLSLTAVFDQAGEVCVFSYVNNMKT